MRTALTFQVVITWIEASVDGPSKIDGPVVATQRYSVPDRLTPCRRTTCPWSFWIWLPITCRPVSGGVGVAPPAPPAAPPAPPAPPVPACPLPPPAAPPPPPPEPPPARVPPDPLVAPPSA